MKTGMVIKAIYFKMNQTTSQFIPKSDILQNLIHKKIIFWQHCPYLYFLWSLSVSLEGLRRREPRDNLSTIRQNDFHKLVFVFTILH